MIEGADSLVLPDRVVLVGETHGTRQVPHAIVELVMAASGSVRVGIEWPVTEQAVIDAFWAGGPLDRTSALWRTPVGVTSVAFVEMLHALRGRPDTHVFAFVGTATSTRSHDEVMADHVLTAYDREPHAAFLILAGNLHCRTRRENEHDALPMGEVLAAQAPVVAFDTTWRRGTAWNVTSTDADPAPRAGVHASTGVDRGDTAHVRWFDRADARGYDGELYLVEVDASPPVD